MQGAPPIDYWQLGLAMIFIVIAGAASLWLKLGLGRELLIGVARNVAQLLLAGYVLLYIFRLHLPWLALAAFIAIIVLAARLASRRVQRHGLDLFRPILISMLLSYSVVTYLALVLVLRADPWWEPRYLLPLGGMVAGAAMNAIALALERLMAEARNRKNQIELMLSLGANRREATTAIFGEAVRAGMIPSINAMMSAGVFFLPGLMSGQIMAGGDPLNAVKYQILMTMMVVGATALGCVIAVRLARARLFNHQEQLVSLSD